MLRKALVALHRWLGLTAGVFLLILGLTGCLLVFEDEIAAALNSQQQVTSQKQQRTGRVLGTPRRQQAAIIYLRELHTELLAGHAGREWTVLGRWITGGVSLLACLMVLTGLPLWLRYRLFGVRWREGGPAIVFDLHNIFGFYTSLVLFVIAATGAAMVFEGLALPGKLVRSLHTGGFWGWPSRILYAAVALLLVIQVITGFAVWARRRRAAQIGMPRGYVTEEQPVQNRPQER